MIAIVNVGPHDDPDPTGWRNYEVRINHEVIAYVPASARAWEGGAMLADCGCRPWIKRNVTNF